jgi:hypothetical protein
LIVQKLKTAFCKVTEVAVVVKLRLVVHFWHNVHKVERSYLSIRAQSFTLRETEKSHHDNSNQKAYGTYKYFITV